MDKVWFRPLVWLDYRLALLFLVIIPVILLIWVLVQKAEVIQRLLMINLRVSSLLAITIYLGIGEFGVSFISGLMARILIPISLWFWVDLNDEIEDQPMSPLKLIFTSWRWAVSVYCALSALASIPFLVCAFSETAIKTDFCRVWFEPPLLYKDYFHHNTKPGFLGFIGIIALIAYVLYLSYFVIIKLGKQGRSATQ